MRKKHNLLVALIISASLFVNCGGLSSKQQTLADEAMKALRKNGAATQVGVNYQQYGSLVIDAQAEVNEALAVLPEGELKKEMNAAMEAYADAGRVWSEKIGSHSLYSDSEPGKTLIPKYSLKTQRAYANSTSSDPDDALQTIWGVARVHLDKASSLLRK